MKKIIFSLAVLSAMLLPTLGAVPAHAGFVQTYVSHNGSDTGGCQTAAQACQSLNYALGQTAAGGQISCLDSGVPDGFITIAISVSINCSETAPVGVADFGGISCVEAITINAPGGIVTLRGLNLNGYYQSPCTNNGIVIQAAVTVSIEDCVIEGFPLTGILDVRTTGLTKLTVKNTIVRNNGSAGIVAAAAPKNSVVLENVHSVGNTYGLGVASGNNVVVDHSVMSENSVAGIEADSGAQVLVDTTKISHNANYGIFAAGLVALSNSDISFNTSSIAGGSLSYGNNRIFANGAGTTPTLIGQQ